MTFDQTLAQEVAEQSSSRYATDHILVTAFVEICRFLCENPDRLSWQGKNKPSLSTEEGLMQLANKFFSGYCRSDFPTEPGTSDQMVSIVMQIAHGYSEEASRQIAVEHQQSMCAENCVGALLERYLDSSLRAHGWYWCCGDFVKAVDFIKKERDGSWLALQIKNRNNSENSSSSAIRNGSAIQKWFRSFSRREEKNWNNVPQAMAGLGLCEEGFIAFARQYLESEKRRRAQ